jgi:hypothetical protein
MAQIMTGAKGQVRINEQVLAYVAGININQENTLSDVDVIGQLEVLDLAETGHKVNFTVNYFKIVNPELAGTAQQIGIEQAVLSDMRNQNYFKVEVLDDNDTIIYQLIDCKFEGGSGQLDARGVWNGTCNFRARKGSGL